MDAANQMMIHGKKDVRPGLSISGSVADEKF